MKRKTIIASLAAAAVVATAASAHARWGKDEHRGHSRAEHAAEHVADHIADKLDLTDEQEMQVRTIFGEHADKFVEQIKNASQTASEKFAADELSEAEAAQIVQSFAAIRETRMNELPSLISAIHAVLTPQQREHASEMLAKPGSEWIRHGFRDGYKRGRHHRHHRRDRG